MHPFAVTRDVHDQAVSEARRLRTERDRFRELYLVANGDADRLGRANDEMCDQIHGLRTERDRYRKALEEIAKGTLRPAHLVADAALNQQQEQGETR